MDTQHKPKTHPPTRRVSDAERKDVNLVIRVTPHTREQLHAAAAARGLTLSDWVRQLAHDEQRSAA